MKTIFLQPRGDLDLGEDTLFITEPEGAEDSDDRHLHFVFPAPVCPGIETLCIILDKPYTVSFEPDSVLLPSLSCIGGQSESGDVWERLFEVIDAPVLTEIGISSFDDIPASVFQKTSLKKIDLDSARVPVSIPDDIRDLVNLEYFKLWRAGISTMSPELFRLPRIREISFYRVYGYEPTPEVIAAAEAFEAAGGLFRSADEAGDIFPHQSKKRAVPEVSPESLPPDPGQERPQKTEVAAVFVLPDTEESSECLQGPKERPVIVVMGESFCFIDQAATYVFPDKPNPALTSLEISAKDSSVLLEGSRLELPNLYKISVSENASLAIFASIAAKLVAPELSLVKFHALENVEFSQSLGLLKSLHVVSFEDCSMLDGGSFPSLDLTGLYFERSTVVGIPDGILNAHSLKSLLFLGCKIDSFDPKILSLPNLRMVCIPFKFPTSPEFWKAVEEFAARGGCLAQELPPDEIEGDCLNGTKPLFKIVAADKNRRFGHLACGIPPSALETEPSQPMPKILIAEDNALNQKVLSLMLGKLGCSPEFVSNGVECVERLKTEDFDMILMDMQMPLMDGFQATREIRALGKSVWITSLDGYSRFGVLECTISGMDDYLLRPWTLAHLSRAINKFRAARAKRTQQARL